jgi:glycosyltransferase involved in cell wall biosynthesis
VACSDAASLPEVCGGAARLFDPSSPESIAGAVDDVLRDPARYRQLGLDRARSFTWEATAQAHEQVYREALS